MQIRQLILALAVLMWSSHSTAYERVISLAPHITELIYTIGAEKKLIATVESSDYPTAALALPRVGDGVSLSAEQLLRLKPDAVFAWQPTRALQAVEPLLAQSQIDLHYINPKSVDEILTQTLQLGDWLGQNSKAQTLVQAWQQQLKQLQQRYHTDSPQTFFIVLNSKPLYTLNDPVVNDALGYCGVQNWARNLWGTAPIIQIEQLLTQPFQGLLHHKKDPALDELLLFIQSAHSRPLAIYEIEADHFHRPGPRLLGALSSLCERISMRQ